MSLLLNELKNAIRAIAARPAFSALIVAVLGSGLACVVFMLSMLNGFVMRPLPFSAPEQLLHAGVREDAGNDLNPLANRDLLAIRRQLVDVADTAGFAKSTMNLSDLGSAERHAGAYVSANLFRVLGVAPLLGRDFGDADSAAGAPAVAMLSYELWQRRYGGDPAIVGKPLRLNAQAVTVIGVMPRDFSYPSREVLWVAAPLHDNVKADDLSFWVVLRRHADASTAAVETALSTWFDQALRDSPDRFRNQHVAVQPLAWLAVAPSVRNVLGIMLAAVAMVLLVACANAANLLLSRTLGRRREFAVRIALGATRRRLVVHLLAECVILSLLATAIALPLAQVGVHWQAAAIRQADFGPPLWLRFDLDAITIAGALAAALLTALMTGLLSALRVGEAAVASGLRDGGRSVAGAAPGRAGRALVIGEVALSCALLISVGTLVRGISALDHVDLGIASPGLLSARLVLPRAGFATPAEQTRLYEQLGERLRADPGVIDATVGTVLPGTNFNVTKVVLLTGVAVGDATLPQSRYGAVDDHFLAATGVTLLQGRFFNDGDRADGARVAVVDERFAGRFDAAGDVIGKQFRLDPRDANGASVTVIGVIGSIKLESPGDARLPALLVPLRQDPFRVGSVLLRTRGEPMAFAPRLAELMREVDADTPLYWVRDYNAVIASGMVGERMVAECFSVFGLFALLLAGAGLYGMVALGVGQRIREVGVRRALGAPNHRVLASLFGRTTLQIGIGLALGLAAGLPFAQLLTTSMQTLEGGNASVVLGALAVLIAAALLAVAIPARRALRVDPIVALHHE